MSDENMEFPPCVHPSVVANFSEPGWECEFCGEAFAPIQMVSESMTAQFNSFHQQALSDAITVITESSSQTAAKILAALQVDHSEDKPKTVEQDLDDALKTIENATHEHVAADGKCVICGAVQFIGGDFA